MKNNKTMRAGKHLGRPMPLAPEQEVVLRFRTALMTGDVERSRREAVETEPAKSGKTDCGPDPGALQT